MQFSPINVEEEDFDGGHQEEYAILDKELVNTSETNPAQ